MACVFATVTAPSQKLPKSRSCFCLKYSWINLMTFNHHQLTSRPRRPHTTRGGVHVSRRRMKIAKWTVDSILIID